MDVGQESTDIELLARQEALHAEAATVLADLDLLRVLAAVGRPVQTGSVVLGLMVWRDIDVTVLCFTDLSNPTSNSIYQCVGYRPVVDIDEYQFDSGSPRQP